MPKLSSWYKSVLLAALFLRLFLLPLFFHPDLKIIYYNSHFLRDGVLNIYEFLASNPALATLGPFVYPPLAYFFFGLVGILINPLAGAGFYSWLGMGNEAVTTPFIFRYLLLTKLPLLAFDLGIAFLFLKLLRNEAERKLAFAFWLFNPINLFATSVMGQFDVIPAFFIVLALLLFSQKKLYQSAFSLGVGAAFKSFPILLLPYLVVLGAKDLRARLGALLIGVLPYLAFIAPFAFSAAFQESVLVSGLSQRIFISSINLGFGEELSVVALLLIFLFFLALSRRGSLTFYGGGALISFLAFTHFHPQWGVWAAPFLSLWAARHERLRPAILLFVLAFFAVVFLFPDRFLGPVLLSPVDPGLLYVPALRELVARVFDPQLLQNLAHATLAASGIWIIFNLSTQNES